MNRQTACPGEFDPAGLLGSGEKLLKPDDPAIRYTGRIDAADPAAPVFIWPYSSAEFRFTGTCIGAVVADRPLYHASVLGCIVDGVQTKIPLSVPGRPVRIVLADHLRNGAHEVFFFKRQDAAHEFTLLGFILRRDARVLPAEDSTGGRMMEIYGDSVACGELAEAEEYTGKADPVHNGELSNAYWSFAAIAARRMNARLQILAHGGLPLLTGDGFCAGSIGLEDVWDKLRYAPVYEPPKPWDFARVTPQAVIMEAVLNDSHPNRFLALDPAGGRAAHWGRRYTELLLALRGKYPKALIVCCSSILQHPAGCDEAIGRACRAAGDRRIVQLRFRRNGTATPGHPRIAEQREMADELCAFLGQYGGELWTPG